MEESITDCSLAGLLKYCDNLGISGKVQKSTASAMKATCERLLVDLSPDEKKDVRKIDVEAAAEKYKKANDPTLKTYREYRRRVVVAIGRFVAHNEALEAELPQVEVAPSPETRYTDTEAEKLVKVTPASVPKVVPSSTSMTLQIPVRSDFVAQLVLPYDLSPTEAARLARLLETLPMGAQKASE